MQFMVGQEVKELFGVMDMSTSRSVEDTLQEVIQSEGIEEDSFFVIDLGTVIRKYEEWRENFPRVEPFYAVKCNPNPAILHTLKHLGVKFDCASRGEIEMVLQLPNSTASDVLFANPCKAKSHLQYAAANGITKMTFDNAHELLKIKQNTPQAEVILRIITDDASSMCQFSNKFGARKRDVAGLLRMCVEMEINLVGVSFHVGSGCRSVTTYIDALLHAKTIFEQAEELGMKLSILDIGGGFPGDDDFEGLSFADIAHAVNPYLDSLFPDTRVIAEPGRYFAASCATLVTSVTAIRRVSYGALSESKEDSPDEAEPFDGSLMGESSHQDDYLVYINDGVYGSFNNIMYDHQHPKPQALYSRARGLCYRTTIFGPTCDGLDCVVKNGLLPRVEVGEWLFWKNMGAYTLAAGSNFNGFQRPHVFYVC